jgi:hypothetical protein
MYCSVYGADPEADRDDGAFTGAKRLVPGAFDDRVKVAAKRRNRMIFQLGCT